MKIKNKKIAQPYGAEEAFQHKDAFNANHLLRCGAHIRLIPCMAM